MSLLSKSATAFRFVRRHLGRFSNKFLLEDMGTRQSGRWAPRLYRIPVVVIALFSCAGVAAWTIFVILGRLSGFHLSWWAPGFGSVPAGSRGDLVRDTLSVLALFGALLAATYAYRKQRVDEAAGYRLDAEGLSKRYQDAANQLGHEKAAVRLAGVYAMARLADEWAEQRQTCVDVLCAYMRMPTSMVQSGVGDVGDIEVRKSIMRVIADHTRHRPAQLTWSENNSDFSGAVVRDLSWIGLDFWHGLSFQDARFEGDCRILNCSFGALGFYAKGAIIRGVLSFDTIQARDSGISLDKVVVEDDARLELSAVGSRPVLITASEVTVRGSLAFEVSSQADAQTTVDLKNVKVESYRTTWIKTSEGISAQGAPKDPPLLHLGSWKVLSQAKVEVEEELINLWKMDWDPKVEAGAAVKVQSRPVRDGRAEV